MNTDKAKTMLSIVLVIGLSVWAFTSLKASFSPYTYILSDTAITITRGRGVVIPLVEIEDAQYYDSLPALSNRVGDSIGNRKSGTFTVADVGRGKVYATDITKPGIILFTHDTFYAITPDDAESFFHQVSAIIGK